MSEHPRFIHACLTISVGNAELDALLAEERHAAVAAFAALQEHLGFVEELHRACSAAMRRARCHDSRVSRKRLASTNSWRASLHWRAMPLARKPAFSSTRPEAGLSAKGPEVSASAPSVSRSADNTSELQVRMPNSAAV